jgi:hypothetical protein
LALEATDFLLTTSSAMVVSILCSLVLYDLIKGVAVSRETSFFYLLYTVRNFYMSLFCIVSEKLS